jgi:hypothetical protein
MVHCPDITAWVDQHSVARLIHGALIMFMLGHTWLVLIIPLEYVAHVFSANSKLFFLASVTLNMLDLLLSLLGRGCLGMIFLNMSPAKQNKYLFYLKMCY